MSKKNVTPASAAQAARGFADKIAPAMRNLNTAGRTYANAGGTLSARVAEAFVAVLAADVVLTAGDASKIVAERCAFTKEAGAPSTNRTWCKAFFDDAANLVNLRRSIVNVEAMTPADYHAAVVAYAKGINPRKAYEDAAKAKKASAKASADAAKAERARQAARDTDEGLSPAVEVVPDSAPALQGVISAHLATLATLDGGPAALATLQAQIAALLAPPVAKRTRTRKAA